MTNIRLPSCVYVGVDGEAISLVTTAPDCAAAHGDSRLAALFDAHHQRLYRLARRLAPSADDARDLVQETFLKVARAAVPVPAGTVSEEAWLVRVMVNVARDGWRRRATRQRSEASGWARPVDPSSGENVEAALVASRTVWQALERLAPRRRAALVLYELEGVGIPEIAALLGVSAVTVRWHLSRGRKEMAAFIGRRGQA